VEYKNAADYKDDFYDWLREITWLLPMNMSVHEARMLYDRKIKDEMEQLKEMVIEANTNSTPEERRAYVFGAETPNTIRSNGTTITCQMAKLPPNCT